MRVLIADDHALFRDGLRSLLEARGLDVGEAKNGREAVVMARRARVPKHSGQGA
jgi:DNA-binding NarL/FixJ family response regulator